MFRASFYAVIEVDRERGRERHGGCEKVGEEIAAVVLTSPSLSLPNNKQTAKRFIICLLWAGRDREGKEKSG